MTSYELYVFLLCMIVFVMLTTLSVVCITIITRLTLRLIRAGAEDEQLAEACQKVNKNRMGCCCQGACCVFSTIVCLVFLALFSLSIYTQCTQERFFDVVPTYRVVLSSSMSKAHKDNTYLEKNGLNNQLQVFDMAAFYKIPPQDQLKLYDVVAYEYEGDLICHRIVEIRKSGDETVYILQGDAVERPDRYPVKYEQMRAIYRGERIPNIGSFVMFLRSPAGWMCILLLVVGMISAPLVDRKLDRERKNRCRQLGLLPPEGAEEDEEALQDV